MNTKETEEFGVTPEWAQERRDEYLLGFDQEIEEMKADIAQVIHERLMRIDPAYKADVLKSEKESLERLLLDFYIFFDSEVKADAPPFRRLLAYETRQIKKHEARLAWLTGSLRGSRGNGITDEMIGKAKEYPFERLIEIGRGGMVKCPFHEDRSPSMLIRNGFAFCFSEQKSWDSIQFIMDQENLLFPDAVRRLQ